MDKKCSDNIEEAARGAGDSRRDRRAVGGLGKRREGRVITERVWRR